MSFLSKVQEQYSTGRAAGADAVVEAFKAGLKKKVGNDETDGKVIYLHKNPIVRREYNGDILVSNAGWGTMTTRDRINGVLRSLGIDLKVSQKGGKQMLGSEEWDGGWKKVGNHKVQ